MSFYFFVVCAYSVLLFIVANGETPPPEIVFSNENLPNSIITTNPTEEESIVLRAPSNCYNCNCQCDRYGWTDNNNRYIGDCRT